MGFDPLIHYFKIFERELSYSLRVVAAIRASLLDDFSKSIGFQSKQFIFAKFHSQDAH